MMYLYLKTHVTESIFFNLPSILQQGDSAKTHLLKSLLELLHSHLRKAQVPEGDSRSPSQPGPPLELPLLPAGTPLLPTATLDSLASPQLGGLIIWTHNYVLPSPVLLVKTSLALRM